MSVHNDFKAWIEHAEDDFANARKLIQGSKPSIYGTCFHAQQCAEKYLKAMLVHKDKSFPMTHDLVLLNDLLTQAQADIKPGQEATWTLMALSAYLPPDTEWQARDGSTWTTERVVSMEAAADISTSACGGAHRLYGLVSALNRHIAASATDTTHKHKTSTQLSGGWAAADDTIESSIERARRFQQADGSFSIHSFDRPGTSADTFAKLSTTGHIFEVLVAWLDDERLGEPWVQRAAERLVTYLEQTADLDVECGALYHASHGLLLFRERMCRSENK